MACCGRSIERRGETTSGGETEIVDGAPEIAERLGDLDLRISPAAFFQTNTEMAEVLYAVAARATPTCRAGSACTTSTAGSARSG